MSNQEYVLKHYRKLAELFGTSPLMSMEDPYVREVEERFFFTLIKAEMEQRSPFGLDIADFGLGNGHTLEALREQYPGNRYDGLEFSPELLEIARKRPGLSHLRFADLRELGSWEQDCQDVIITQRSVINLLSWRWQRNALETISKALRVGGVYLMSESFTSGIANLNRARTEFKLEEMNPSKHNRFLKEKVTGLLKGFGLVEEKTEWAHKLSTHFFLTRVYHPIIKAQGRRKRSEITDFFDHALPLNVGNYAPIQFRVFRKVGDFRLIW